MTSSRTRIIRRHTVNLDEPFEIPAPEGNTSDSYIVNVEGCGPGKAWVYTIEVVEDEPPKARNPYERDDVQLTTETKT